MWNQNFFTARLPGYVRTYISMAGLHRWRKSIPLGAEPLIGLDMLGLVLIGLDLICLVMIGISTDRVRIGR